MNSGLVHLKWLRNIQHQYGYFGMTLVSPRKSFDFHFDVPFSTVDCSLSVSLKFILTVCFCRRLPTEVADSIKQILPGYTGTPSPDPRAGYKRQSPRINSPSPRMSPSVRSALDNVDLRDSMNNYDDDDVTPRNSCDRVQSGSV